jgi:hypothetical protein
MRAHLLLGIVTIASAVAAQDVYDLPWRVSAKGELEVQMPASDSIGKPELQLDRWTPMFPWLFARDESGERRFEQISGWSSMLALPLLVHGDGGAAAIPEATRRMQKLGIPATIDRAVLRNLLRDPWRDLLHVQHLASTEAAIATLALHDLSSNVRADAFVRAAAAEALSQRIEFGMATRAEVSAQRVRRNGSAALHQGLMLLPDTVDLVLGIHGAALPSLARALSAWRRFHLLLASGYMLEQSYLSPGQATIAAMLGDRPGQLPFELARRVGNWRVDHALLALAIGDDGGWWIHAGGLFQPERIAEGLRAGGFEIERATATEVRAVVHGFVMRATPHEFEAWSEHLAPGSRGSRVGTLRDRADAGAPPVWMFVPATSRLAADSGFAGTALDVRFDPAIAKASATATATDDATATKLLAAWRDWQAARRCDPDDKIGGEDNHFTWRDAAEAPPGCGEHYRTRLVWRRCVQAVQGEQQAAAVRWSLDLTPFPLVDLVRFLGDSPATFLRDG